MPDNVKITTGLKNANLNEEIKAPGPKSATVFAREDKYCAHNYAPIPVALTRGKGKDFRVKFSNTNYRKL